MQSVDGINIPAPARELVQLAPKTMCLTPSGTHVGTKAFFLGSLRNNSELKITFVRVGTLDA